MVCASLNALLNPHARVQLLRVLDPQARHQAASLVAMAKHHHKMKRENTVIVPSLAEVPDAVLRGAWSDGLKALGYLLCIAIINDVIVFLLQATFLSTGRRPSSRCLTKMSPNL